MFTQTYNISRSSFQVKGWELGQHGDVGANGRGSLLQFRKLNTKIIVGYHSPGRKMER
jgi:hypothetical protein